ncbi:MAG: methylmalonyl Co-A mutase-associated GTPase MeaB [bacterium]
MKKNTQNTKELIGKMFQGNVRALSRLMTLVENRPEALPEVMSEIYNRRKPARRVGLSGPPGAGKSTLLSNLIQAGLRGGKQVSALCIDPTSPLSGGAILGDRIRMANTFNSKDVFIRSVASGDSLGGLAEATKYHTLLLEAFGSDLVLIETVGLGQVGYDIRNIAETLILILVPESGDTVQILKSGIIELADIIVINKSDRSGADEIAATLEMTFDEPRDGWRIPVIKASAREDIGTDDIIIALDAHYEYLNNSGRLEVYRDPAADLREAVEFQFQRRMRGGLLENHTDAAAIAKTVISGDKDPYTASVEIMNLLIEGKNNG